MNLVHNGKVWMLDGKPLQDGDTVDIRGTVGDQEHPWTSTTIVTAHSTEGPYLTAHMTHAGLSVERRLTFPAQPHTPHRARPGFELRWPLVNEQERTIYAVRLTGDALQIVSGPGIVRGRDIWLLARDGERITSPDIAAVYSGRRWIEADQAHFSPSAALRAWRDGVRHRLAMCRAEVNRLQVDLMAQKDQLAGAEALWIKTLGLIRDEHPELLPTEDSCPSTAD